jgi:predicted nucleic acid-binding Zn ribbon protein
MFLVRKANMTTYVYETIPSAPGQASKRFEILQRMTDQPLQAHPDTGEPVRRVISGGFGLMGVGEKNAPVAEGGGCCGGGSCGCH